MHPQGNKRKYNFSKDFSASPNPIYPTGLAADGVCDLQISQAGDYLFLYLTILPAIAFLNLAVPCKWGLFLNWGAQLTWDVFFLALRCTFIACFALLFWVLPAVPSYTALPQLELNVRCSTASESKYGLRDFTQFSVSLNYHVIWFGKLTANMRLAFRLSWEFFACCVFCLAVFWQQMQCWWSLRTYTLIF